MPAPARPIVAILLCTYDGARFLDQQLASFAAQTCDTWRVWASDDGSGDETVAVLDRQRRRWSGDRLTIVSGPRRGFAANFRFLLSQPQITADAYAYADQDDVWVPDKLERALRWLTTVPPAVPALYCSRTTLVDEAGRPIGRSPLHRRPPSFANALVQNIAGGNTMVFNDAARRLLVATIGAAERAVIYDWWTYLIVSGGGGRVHYDAVPTVQYRQHVANQVGANVRLRERMGNMGQVFRGRMKRWIDGNIEALMLARDVLSPEACDRLNRFALARKRSLIPRLVELRRAGVYRQTWTGEAGLMLAALVNRL